MNEILDHDPEDSYRHGLRQRIDAAKARLPLPDLMELLGDGDSAARSALCPFHYDEHPSFSVFETDNGRWRWNCFAGCGAGDEIDYLVLREELTKAEAIEEYLRLAEEHGEDNE
jgi:DNA primase